MTNDGTLSEDRIAELFEAAQRGEAPPAPRRGGARRGVRVRPVDFSRPTKFTTEQERRVSRSLEAFCRAASTRVSAELRVAFDLDVINVNQLNWSHAHGQLPSDAVCAMLDVKPHETTLLFTVERAFVLQAIDLLLGGAPDVSPRERRLTDIDWALTKHVLALIIGQLSVIWQDIAGVELGVAGLESQMETAQVAAVSEPTLAVTVEARLGRSSSTMMLLLPHHAVEAFIESFSGEDGRSPSNADASEQAMRGAVSRVDVTLRAEVAAVELTATELLALQPGDLLRLEGHATSGVTVYADDVPVCRAHPGRSGRRRAIQVLDADGGSA